MAGTARFGVSRSPGLLGKFDGLIDRRGYANRSEAIRDLVREMIVEEEVAGGDEIVGTLTLVYDHEARDLVGRLTDIQHGHHGEIISSLHIHLDAHNCLEVLVLRGKADRVKEIADRIISTKDVKHGRLTMTTTGRGLT